MKTINYSLVLIASLFFLVANDLYAQADIEKSIEKAIQKNADSAMNNQEDRLISSVDNSVKQYNEVDRLIEEQEYMKEQINARKLLATQLCLLDPKACYLIDNYSQYRQENEKILQLEDLKLFGKDLFTGYPLNFDIVDNTPVPDYYILGFGDILTLNILGPRPDIDYYPISRDGTINIPEFGSVYVQNLTFKEAQEKISSFVASKGIGADVFISIKELKNITVNVGGSTRYPGTYKISSQSSALNVLATVGGLFGNPSLRNVKIISLDGSVAYEDLYDSLVFGRSSKKNYLKSGDTVHIPAAENFVYLIGNVNRQAMYEFKQGETTTDLLKMGLGVKPNTDEYMVVKRLNSNGSYISIPVTSANPLKLQNGDILTVNELNNKYVDGIKVFGAIRKPGQYKLTTDNKLSSIISINNDVIESTYLPLFVIRKFNQPTNSWKYEFYNLLNQSEFESILLSPKDQIYFLSNNDIKFLNSRGLRDYIQEANQTLYNLSSSTYDRFESNISNLDENNQGLSASSNLDALNKRLQKIENTSINLANDQIIEGDRSCFDNLSSALTPNLLKEVHQKTSTYLPKNKLSCTPSFSEHDFLLAAILQQSLVVFGEIDFPGVYPLGGILQPSQIFDIVHASDSIENFNLSINNKLISEKSFQVDTSKTSFLTFNEIIKPQVSRFVHLKGEFVNPGTYPIFDGDTITDVYERAGGFKETAFPNGAIFTREYLKQEEAKTLKLFRNSISEILTNAISNGYLRQNPTDLMVLMDVMAQANSAAVSGRLVTDLTYSIKNTSKDIAMLDGDMIYMPRRANTVNVSGQVLNPTSLVYSPDSKPYDYINLAGGLKDGADKSSIYVINPNGETFNLKASRSFGFRNQNSVMPGATIIVPRKARNLDGLGLIERIAPTIASLSVTAASIAAIQD